MLLCTKDRAVKIRARDVTKSGTYLHRQHVTLMPLMNTRLVCLSLCWVLRVNRPQILRRMSKRHMPSTELYIYSIRTYRNSTNLRAQEARPSQRKRATLQFIPDSIHYLTTKYQQTVIIQISWCYFTQNYLQFTSILNVHKLIHGPHTERNLCIRCTILVHCVFNVFIKSKKPPLRSVFPHRLTHSTSVTCFICIFTSKLVTIIGFEHVTYDAKQVAQLWQKNRAKLDTFSINVQRYSQYHAQNWIFGPPWGHQRQYKRFIWKFWHQKNFVAEFHRENGRFTRKTANWRF